MTASTRLKARHEERFDGVDYSTNESTGVLTRLSTCQRVNVSTDQMNSRRRFLTRATLLVLAPRVANAQSQPRIGLLSIGTDPIKPNQVWVAFLDGLARLGYVEGQNIQIVRRFAGGKEEQLPGFVADLARLRLDVAVGTGDIEALALKRAMPSTPVVMVLVQDPVGAGLVQSLARPGTNVTGLTTQAPELYAKRLELLKEAVPSIRNVALLLNPSSLGAEFASRRILAAARAMEIRLHVLAVRSPGELDGIFATLDHQLVQAIIVVTDGVIFNQRFRIAELAAKGHVPVIYDVGIFVDAGGLLSYGPSYTDLAAHAAVYVDKILKGAKAADLPVEQPTRFELVINMKTAKALGIAFPQSVLLRADRVIE